MCRITLRRAVIVVFVVSAVTFYTGFNDTHEVTERARHRQRAAENAIHKQWAAQNARHKQWAAQNARHKPSTSQETENVTKATKLKKSGPDQWDVYISAYMRSGSSYLAEMFGHRRDSFYWYEPLWKPFPWWYFREDNRLCHVTKAHCQPGLAAENLTKSLDTLIDILRDCNLRVHADTVVYPDQTSQTFAGNSWEPYRRCMSLKGTNSSHCLAKLEPVCRQARHRVLKELRLDFTYSETLLIADGRLKAILLVRDPRGIINSHIRTRWFPMSANKSKELRDDAAVMCARLWRDIRSANLLISRYPDRVKIVQYEDLGDPIKNAKLLHSFLGMDPSFLQVWSIMKKSKGKDLFGYRKTMHWQTVKMVDSVCGDVIKGMGLVKYQNETHLRDSTQSPIVGSLTYSMD